MPYIVRAGLWLLIPKNLMSFYLEPGQAGCVLWAFPGLWPDDFRTCRVCSVGSLWCQLSWGLMVGPSAHAGNFLPRFRHRLCKH